MTHCADTEFALNVTGGNFRSGATVSLRCFGTNATGTANATNTTVLECLDTAIVPDGTALRATCPPLNATARCTAAVRNMDLTQAVMPEAVAFHVYVPCMVPAALGDGQLVASGNCGVGVPVGAECIITCASDYVGPNATLVCTELGEGRSDYVVAGAEAGQASPCARLRFFLTFPFVEAYEPALFWRVHRTTGTVISRGEAHASR